MTKSMTAYASQSGTHGDVSWVWELRGVNGKGFDLRARVPDWIEGLEPALRAALSAAVKRGNIQASLKVTRAETPGSGLNSAALATVLDQIKAVETAARTAEVTLSQASAVDILGLRAVSDGANNSDNAELAAEIRADIAPLVAGFVDMRAREGAALHEVITAQLEGIKTLVQRAADCLPERAKALEEATRAGVARILKATDTDEQRLLQELAVLAIKSDVTEELDRLRAHITAAREMIATAGPVGRKLDFMMQEFNREANTLCAKSAHAELTAIGLDLKVGIDQMREQIQNVE